MSGESGLRALEWPAGRAADAVRALAQAMAVTTDARGDGNDDAPLADANDGAAPSLAAGALGEMVCAAAAAVGLDAEPIDLPVADTGRVLRESAPLLLRLHHHSGVLAILRVRGATATVVGATGRVEISLTTLEAALQGDAAGAAITSELRKTLTGVAGMPPPRGEIAVRQLMAPLLRGRPAAEGWVVRRGATGIREALRAARIYRRGAAIVLGYLVQFALFFGIWREVGARSFRAASGSVGSGGGGGATEGARGWLWFFVLLAAWVMAQLLGSAAVSRLALDIGSVIRSALVRGALRLDAGRMRAAGIGELLGRALEADALDVLALGGGVETVAGLFELALGAAVVAHGVAPRASLAVLLATVATLWAVGRIHARRLRAWNDRRRGLTHELVERMVGHRTVLVQDRPARRARADDAALTAYDGSTRALDRAEVWLTVLVPRVWLLAALLALAPVVLGAGGAVVGAPLALSVGGVWLSYGALRRLGMAMPMLALAREAWRQIAPLVGSRADSDGAAGAAVTGRHANDLRATTASGAAGDAPPQLDTPLLVVDDVSFRYPGRPSAVLHGVNVAVSAGDCILLQGSSGGGKSTLAALMTGLRPPTTGTLRLHGRDQAAVGLGRWRGTIGGAPQFHDNHVFGTDLLFNLLMGRRWPPRRDDIVAAERVCRDLGLGGLLERMPAGLQQQVGETGWQLSHGERSRLFVARSLLQMLDARVLDESFAALDPETLDQVMAAVLARPQALIVIAHP